MAGAINDGGASITLAVNDLDTSFEFYVSLLGFTVGLDRYYSPPATAPLIWML